MNVAQPRVSNHRQVCLATMARGSLPTTIDWPVMLEFFATVTNKSAQSSRSVLSIVSVSTNRVGRQDILVASVQLCLWKLESAPEGRFAPKQSVPALLPVHDHLPNLSTRDRGRWRLSVLLAPGSQRDTSSNEDLTDISIRK